MACEFSINTAAGMLRVEEWTDPNYPGLTVYRNDDQVAVVECKAYDMPNAVFVHVWSDDAGDPIFDSYYEIPGEHFAVGGAGFAVETPAGVIAPASGGSFIDVYVDGTCLLHVDGSSGQLGVMVWSPNGGYDFSMSI